MDIGESISIAMQSNEDCPMEHDEPVPIESQPAKGEKDVETLKKNMRDGKGTILFDVDDDGKMEDVGLNAYTTKEPTPEKALTKTDKNPIKFGDGEYPLSMAAHHVIPGKASLPDSGLAEFIWKSEGKIFSDIGYHVDGAENGVWLPTHGKLSHRMSKGTIKVDGQQMKYAEASSSGRVAEESTGAASFIRSYTQKAMDFTNAQFHDSHTEYSDKVMEKLDAIHAWVSKASGDDCSDCEKAKSPDGKLPPPHLLAFRLNALSKHLRTFLLGPPVMWRTPLFTSKYAKEYKEIDEKFRKYRGGA